MRYLVTGYRGFLGQRLVASLESLGLEVIKLGGLDVADKRFFNEVDASEGDVLIHLANKSFVPESWTEPHRYFDVNLMGTINALEFCKKKKVGLVYISSYMYGDPDYFPIDEKHPVKANNPYALSKKFSEEIIGFYGASLEVKYNVIRPFNIYGAHQKDNFIIPILVNQLMDDETKEVTILDARPKRDFIHVQDVVDAIILASKKLNNEIYNVCSGYSISLEELYETMLRISGMNKKLVDKMNHRKNEIMDCYGSYEKIEKHLGWRPKVTLEEGLKECLNTNKNHGDKK